MKPDQFKKTVSRRRFLISGSLLAGATLAACAAPPAAQQPQQAAAPTEQKPAEKPTEAPTEAPKAAPTPMPEPTVAVGEYGTGGNPVVLWSGLTGADGATFAKMLQDYAETNNTAVRSETYDWNLFFQKYPTAIAAGLPPDWAIFHATEVPQMTSQNMMMPMDEVYATQDIPKDDFVKPVMDVLTIDGKTMAVPFDSHGWTCFVNTELVKAAGFDPNSLPANGEDFLKFAYKVATDENGKHPDESGYNPEKMKTWPLHFSWGARYTMGSTWLQFHQGKGGVFDPETNKEVLDSEKSTAAVQYWHDLMYKHKVVPPFVFGVNGYDLFKGNALAVMWDGTWSFNFFKDNPDIEKKTIAVTTNSLAPDGFGGQKIDAHIMSIPPGVKPEGIDRASKLIKWLSENGKTWATSGQIPARLSVQKDPAVQAIWSVKAAAEAFAKQGYPDTPHKAYIEIQTAWEPAAQAVLSNPVFDKGPLVEGGKQVQAILDRG